MLGRRYGMDANGYDLMLLQLKRKMEKRVNKTWMNNKSNEKILVMEIWTKISLVSQVRNQGKNETKDENNDENNEITLVMIQNQEIQENHEIKVHQIHENLQKNFSMN